MKHGLSLRFTARFCFRPFLQERLASRGPEPTDPSPGIPRTNAGIIQVIPPDGYITGGSHALADSRGCCRISVPGFARYYDELLVDEGSGLCRTHDFDFLLELCRAGNHCAVFAR